LVTVKNNALVHLSKDEGTVHTMKGYGEVEVYLHTFTASAIDVGKVSVVFQPFYPQYMENRWLHGPLFMAEPFGGERDVPLFLGMGL